MTESSKPLRLSQGDALLLARCAYAGLLVILWPFKSPRPLSELGSNHFHPPLGPFALFDSYPPLWFVIAIETVTFLLLALWVAGFGRWIVGLALTLALTTLSGFVYAAGKIDHDFVILLVPLLLTLPCPSPKHSLFFCIAVYFASSGFAKAGGGWLDPHTQASLSWALTYFHAYEKSAPLLEWSLTTLPGWSWELLDQFTVWFELVVPFVLLPRFRVPLALAIPVFHFGTVLLFGIDFARLLLVYLPLALLCCVDRDRREHASLSKRTRLVLMTITCFALALSWLHLWFRGDPWSLSFPVSEPGLVLFPLFEIALVVAVVRRRATGRP